ncbi:C-factor (C signal) [Durusdinium trenchii]|uniref:C-factor (C signal) n=1 Tax=Durusdinium trenchii TaxID=1381693 RepID=A0ABP0LRI1_9DINO
MAYSFAVNAIGPVLVLKHFAPLLKSGAAGDGDRRSLAKAIFYSARVGSIGDNATGGWYSYRSSKAALNQILRSASVELRRSAVCCVALHPGTVDTDLTRAFARARAKYKVQDVNEAAEKHLALIDSWSMADSGHFFDWQGKEVPCPPLPHLRDGTAGHWTPAMPLYGLPGLPGGSCAVAAGASMILCTSGLALLRGSVEWRVTLRGCRGTLVGSERGVGTWDMDGMTTPAGAMAASRPLTTVVRIGKRLDSVGNFLGLLGAVQLYAGLVLGELPFILGFPSLGAPQRAPTGAQRAPEACWLVERFWLTDAPLPAIQNAICLAIGLASTLIDWAGPTPYDDMRLGFASQIAGCDGGFRSPFILYVSVWVTGLVFGVLLLILEEGSLFSSWQWEKGLAVRQKALPVVYGLATSMSCVIFATGSASNDFRWVTAGVLLLVVSVLCAWDALWCLDMNLATFAALFHGFSTALRAIQNHAVFRDLRWDPEDAQGLLAVYETPGLQIFMFGMLLMFLSLQFYLATCHWTEWRASSETSENGHLYDEVPLAQGKIKDHDSEIEPEEMCRESHWWQWVLLPICMTCQIIGVHVPLIFTECIFPNLTWVQDDPKGYKMSQGESYIDVIRWLYQRRLPCSALVAAYNAMLLPPFQFLLIFFILLRPRFLPSELRRSMQNYVMTLAPMRFTQPSIMMLVVGVASLPMENQHRDNLQYGGHFTSGYWFFMTYCLTNLLLAWSVQPPELPAERKVPAKRLRRDPLLQMELKKHWRTEGEDQDELFDESLGGSRASLAVSGTFAAGVGVATCIWVALTNPYLEFEFRIAGVVIHRVTPTVLDLWYSIGSVNRFLMCYCAATLIVFPLLWLVLLGRRLASARRPWLEPLLRPLVMCHIWAASLVLIYYIVAARNKNTLEVCARFPNVPVAAAAIILMGAGTFALIQLAKGLRGQEVQPAAQMTLPPGGKALWLGGPACMMLALVGWLSTCGPQRPPVLQSLQDLNQQFVRLGPVANEHLYKDVSESFGDCAALQRYQAEQGEASKSMKQSCSGSTALFQKELQMGSPPQRHLIKTVVLWAQGMNTLEVHRVRVQPPPNPLVATQAWHLNVSAAFNDLHVFMKVSIDDKEWFNGYMCCDQPFHFTLQVGVLCQQHQGFEAMEVKLLQMDQVALAHDAAVMEGPAWAAVTSDVGRREMVKQVMEDFLSLHNGQALLQSLNKKASHARQIASDVLSDVVRLNTGAGARRLMREGIPPWLGELRCASCALPSEHKDSHIPSILPIGLEMPRP